MMDILVTRSSMPGFSEYCEEIKDLWESHWLTNMGEKHKTLAKRLEEYLGVQNIDLLVNGHMALELSIQALKLTGEVITTPFTFASTTHAIVRNGLTPVFCDIDPETFCIDTERLEDLITDRTSAIIPVHVYGNICNVEEIRISDKKSFWQYCKDKGITVPKRIDAGSEYRQPFVLKPSAYILDGVNYSPVIVNSEAAFERCRDLITIPGMEAYEYIDANSYYLMMYFSLDGGIRVLCQKNLAQQPGGKSMIAAMLWKMENDEIETIYKRILNELGFYGFIMIELRKQNEEYYMIEANPRMWGPSQLLVDCGSCFFESFLMDYGVIDHFNDNVVDMNAKYYWSEGVSECQGDIVYLNHGETEMEKEKNIFLSYDIYDRKDTIRLHGRRRRTDA